MSWPEEAYPNHIEESNTYDHRKLGRELDLFSISRDVGQGLVLWHPKGAILRMVVEDFIRQIHQSQGYSWIQTPHIGHAKLWQTSGHLDIYSDRMFAPIECDDTSYYLKPTNYPFHIQVYQSQYRNFFDLPLRYVEFGTVYRYEPSGSLYGLIRTRGYTHDDAHIFCRHDQVEYETHHVLDLALSVLHTFGLQDYHIYLCTQPSHYLGTQVQWDIATQILQRVVESFALPYTINPGKGAFYGPKLDLKVYDRRGYAVRLSTIQLDFNLPARFGVVYCGDDGHIHQPWVIHRAILGSIERFLGILIEQYGGAFPFWLAPVQVVVLPIANSHRRYAQKVYQRLRQVDVRVTVDDGKHRLGSRIRYAHKQKVPYILLVGDKEQDADAVNVRLAKGNHWGMMSLETFITSIQQDEAKHMR